MRLIFIDDGPIYVDSKGNYYEYAFHGLYKRYSYLADEITFITRVQDRSDKTDGTLIPKEVRIVSIPNYKAIGSYVSQKKLAEAVLEKEVSKTDIVILRGSSAGHIALKYVKKYHKPYIYECVACDWDKYWNYSFVGKCIAPVMDYKEKKAVWNSPFVYYVTQKYLQERYPTKGISIGCSNVVIDETDKSVLGQRIVRQKKKSFNKDKLIIGTAAAVDVRYKGQDDVIKAIGLLKEQGTDIEYHIVGSNRSGSTYLSELSKRLGVEDCVIYCGSLSSDEMFDFYDTLDVYIQPSKQEGLPRSLIEAMSRGLPCIASNIAGNPELLGTEFLFSKGKPDEIAEKIKCISSVNLEAVSRQNFEKANREYNAMILNDRREGFYKEFLDHVAAQGKWS